MVNSFPQASEEPSRWYVLNAIFGKELQTCQLLRQEEIECFVPMRYEMRRVKQKPVRVLVPAVHNLVFVHATKAYLEDFKSRVPFTLYFMTRKEGVHRTLLTVPDGEMSAFIRVARMVEEKRWDHLLNVIPIHKGDCFYIPSGTIHAIRRGTLLLEIQQNSDLTYRLYDYGRRRRLPHSGQLWPLSLSGWYVRWLQRECRTAGERVSVDHLLRRRRAGRHHKRGHEQVGSVFEQVQQLRFV